jgi:hypothetical protein
LWLALAFVVLLAGLVGASGGAGTTAWGNSTFLYKKPVYANLSAGSTTFQYVQFVNVTYSSKMQSDFKDIRFFNGSENTELPYWIEDYVAGQYANVWVLIDQNLSTANYTYYLYYSNTSTVSSASNIERAFMGEGDDFNDGAFNASKWWVSAGPAPVYDEYNGYLHYNASTGAGYSGIGLLYPNGTNYILSNVSVISRFRFVGTFSALALFQLHRWPATGNSGYAFGDSLSVNSKWNLLYNASAMNTSDSSAASTWFKLRMDVAGNTIRTFKNAVLQYVNTTITPGTGGLVSLGYWSGGTTAANNIDYWAARRIVDPEPTTAFGAETFINDMDVYILIPTNSTYITDAFNTSFYYVSKTNASANCTRFLDGAWFNDSISNNNTVYSDVLPILALGGHSYAVNCSNTTVWTYEEVDFSILYASLNNCSGGTSIPTLRFYLRNETNDQPVFNGTIEVDPILFWTSATGITYDLGNYPFTFNLTAVTPNGSDNATICLTPNYTTVMFTDMIVYKQANASQRSYNYYGILNNVTKEYYLYLLETGKSDQVIVYVTDENNMKVPGVWVQAQRYYVGNASYKTVAQVKMDNDGKGTTYLETLDTFYRFVITSNGTTLAVLPPTIITCPTGSICPPYTITLRMTELGQPQYLKKFGEVSAGCTFDNVGLIILCTAIDASGNSVHGRLLVEKREAMNFSYYCDNSSVSSSIGLACYLPHPIMADYATYRYSFTGWWNDPNNTITFASDILDFGASLFNWGSNGLILTFLIVMTMFAVGLWNPVVSIALGIIGLVFSSILGLAFVTLPSLMGIIIVGVLLAWKLKT